MNPFPLLIISLLSCPLAAVASEVPLRGTLNLNQPIAVYNNWSAYDELSDNIDLTEKLAMTELDQIVRLKRAGVRIDYYVMDAFWYSTNGGFREFRQPHWPEGPDRWLKACHDNQIKPGLWFPCNVPFRIEVLPEWRSSLDVTSSAMCYFDGDFLPQFISTLQFWYDRGVRLFKFDFANFTIATPAAAKQFSKDEIVRRNCDAFRAAIRQFKEKNPEALFAAFNGFGGDTEGTAAPIRQTVDLRWLEAFDSLYCGDPRLADVPAMNFWRSMDIYSDHMVRYYEANGVPLERIDNTGCMFGVAGTCYRRRAAAWKSMLLLEHARGGWMNVYYGNLELLNNEMAQWFAKVQKIYFTLQSFGRTYPFGGLPGRAQPYGFSSVGENGAIYTVVNPSQSVADVKLPQVHRLQFPGRSRILFRDSGFQPKLSGDRLKLGPEQLAVVGTDEYAEPKYDLGVQQDVLIPQNIRPAQVEFAPTGSNSITASFSAPTDGDMRVIMRQTAKGKPLRSSKGAPPDGTSLAKILQIEILQDGKSVPIKVNYDEPIWSGLSWAVCEAKARDFKAGRPLTIKCVSLDGRPLTLTAEVYLVNYK